MIADYGSNAVYEAAPLGNADEGVDLSGSPWHARVLAVDGAGNSNICPIPRIARS